MVHFEATELYFFETAACLFGCSLSIRSLRRTCFEAAGCLLEVAGCLFRKLQRTALRPRRVYPVFRGCCASGDNSNNISELQLLCNWWQQQQDFEVVVRLVAAATVFRSCCSSGGCSISKLLCVWWQRQQYFGVAIAVRLVAAATVFQSCCVSGGCSTSRLLCVWWQRQPWFQSC